MYSGYKKYLYNTVFIIAFIYQLIKFKYNNLSFFL